VSMSWAIETFTLTKRFPKSGGWRNLLSRQLDEPAVNAVDLQVQQGELFGLVGPNGAGKTTLIKMLSTLILPTSGDALVDGHPLGDEMKIKQSVGLVTSDERSFFWRLTGRQNLAFFAVLQGLSGDEARERIDSVLAFAGLSQRADSPFQNYSTGMRQRLSIARSLLVEPQILFLDEPTKGLDPEAKRQLHELVREQLTRQRGLTVFMTSHNLNEVELLCDRIAIIRQGKIMACGAMAELRAWIGAGKRYQIQVRGWDSQMGGRLHAILPDVEIDQQDDLANLQFDPEDGELSLNQTIDYLREEGVVIQSIVQQEASLEDIFSQIKDQVISPSNPQVEIPPAGNQENPGFSHAQTRRKHSILDSLRVAVAFLRRDVLMEMSYKFSFLLQFIGIFFSVAVFYFVSQMLGVNAIAYLEPYGGNYFSFVLIGIAFSGYFSVGLSSFSQSLRNAQTTGTLEAMLSTPTGISTIILSSSQWSYLMTTMRVVVSLAMGVFLLGVDLGDSNFAAALLILFLTVISFSSLGIIAASFIMVLKRGDPVTWIFGVFSNLLGGVYYPITVLPEWLQKIAGLLPITYSLRSMRLALLKGAGFEELKIDFLVLTIFCIVLLPLSLLTFRFAVERARRDGSLAHY
jgi:ABC-type multidrug transport system ATPase subunit/ABC-type multidrug transport system permease subunit